jgi:hypothetical protein
MCDVVGCILQLIEVRLLRVQGALQVTEQIENTADVVRREFEGLAGPLVAGTNCFPAAQDNDRVVSLYDFGAQVIALIQSVVKRQNVRLFDRPHVRGFTLILGHGKTNSRVRVAGLAALCCSVLLLISLSAHVANSV